VSDVAASAAGGQCFCEGWWTTTGTVGDQNSSNRRQVAATRKKETINQKYTIIGVSIAPPILLLGDFNAHINLWGCVDIKAKGVEVAAFLLQSNLCLLNKKDLTYIHPATGSHSSIDLAICDPALFLNISWNVNNDLCRSDHFLVILSTCRSGAMISAMKNRKIN